MSVVSGETINAVLPRVDVLRWAIVAVKRVPSGSGLRSDALSEFVPTSTPS